MNFRGAAPGVNRSKRGSRSGRVEGRELVAGEPVQPPRMDTFRFARPRRSLTGPVPWPNSALSHPTLSPRQPRKHASSTPLTRPPTPRCARPGHGFAVVCPIRPQRSARGFSFTFVLSESPSIGKPCVGSVTISAESGARSRSHQPPRSRSLVHSVKRRSQ